MISEIKHLAISKIYHVLSQIILPDSVIFGDLSEMNWKRTKLQQATKNWRYAYICFWQKILYLLVQKGDVMAMDFIEVFLFFIF